MLAARLHRTPNPWLRRGAYLVPITLWDGEGVSAAQSVRWWRKALENPLRRRRRGRPNRTIRYITLVRIPDDFPVWVADHWQLGQEMRDDGEPFEFRPLREAMADFPLGEINEHWFCAAELILGRSLPKSAILWTKDVRLLYRRRKKRTRVCRVLHEDA